MAENEDGDHHVVEGTKHGNELGYEVDWAHKPDEQTGKRDPDT